LSDERGLLPKTGVSQILKSGNKIGRFVVITTTKMPEPRMTLEAIFLIAFRLDSQSMGSGMAIKYMSVETLDANEAQTMGFEMVA
jgi:hypothetical protein